MFHSLSVTRNHSVRIPEELAYFHHKMNSLYSLILLLINLVAIRCDQQSPYASIRLARELRKHRRRIDLESHMHDRVKPKHYRTIIREYSLENSYQSSDESVRTGENLNLRSVAKNSTNSSGDGSLAIEPSARTRSYKGNRPRYQKRESISGNVAAIQQLARSLNILNTDFYSFRKEQNERMHNLTKLLDRITMKSRKAEKERKRDSRRNSSQNKKYKSRTEDVTDTKDQNNITNKNSNNTDQILNNIHNETFNNTQNKEELDQEPIKSKTHTQTNTNAIHTIQNNTDNKVHNNTDKEELEQKPNKGRTLTEIDTNTKPIHKNITQSNDLGNALKIHQTVPKQAPKASGKNDLHDVPPRLRHLPYHKVTIYRAQRKKNKEYPL